MSQRHDDADPIEHDPTGMRALLGGLPDPGPMPDDLVARIEAAVAAEVGPWQVEDGDGSADTTTGERHGHRASVVPLHRRPLWRVAGVAAAAVVAVGVGGVALQAFQTGGVSASLGTSAGSDSGADDAAGTDLRTQEGSGDSGADGGPDAGPESAADGVAPEVTVRLVAADEGALVRVVGSEGTVDPDGLVSAVAVLAVPPYDVFPDATTQGEEDEGLEDPARARDCAGSLGVPPTDAVVVQLTAVGSTPDAALVVATAADGTRTVWAVPGTCGADGASGGGSVEVIAGPVATD